VSLFQEDLLSDIRSTCKIWHTDWIAYCYG